MKQRLTFRCEPCNDNDAIVNRETAYDVCAACGECVTRLAWCIECAEDPAAAGCDSCLNCIADAVILQPSELDELPKNIRLDLVPVLVGRLKPFMRMRQAA